ncbi:MAG: FAD-dependent monooxygenase, partial [Hylemonella sp.]|nr:FAD-dependent monooxygenase [Hylemonella sp.]
GGGIGGLSAALACLRCACEVRLFEQADDFSEFGAGIQLGPNVTRVLHAWGLAEPLSAVAAFPEVLKLRDARSGAQLGALQLGAAFVQRYGAPYATIHRADLQALLLEAVQRHAQARFYLRSQVVAVSQDMEGVTLQTLDGRQAQGDALVGADGIRSRVRAALLNDAPARATGHLAYRALVSQQDLPATLRSQQVTVWMGERLHVVQYPVCGGEFLNVVAVIHGQIAADAMPGWDHAANAADLRAALAATTPDLRKLIEAIDAWRLWPLYDRPPMQGANEQAQGRVALLGDAAHPMRPYLAQGAGMAIEDAAALGAALGRGGLTVAEALGQYAHQRWQRNAQVQAKAIRNGQVFHAAGPVRWGRDMALRLLGERVLDQPWLYGQS